MIAAASRTIIDLFDPIQQGTEPLSPVMDMLWLDTSLVPNQFKRWNGTVWTVVNDTSTLQSRITTAELLITDEAIVGTVRGSYDYADDLSRKVATDIYETKISAIEGAIALKTDQITTSDLATRVATAEQMITPDAITSTVRSSDTYKQDFQNVTTEIATVQSALGTKIDASAIADMATTAYVQSAQSTEITQRNNAIVLAVQAETTRAVAAEGEIKTFTDKAKTYFSFDLDGLRISEAGSPFSTLTGHDKYSFEQDGVEVAYIQYNKLYIKVAEITDMLTIGNSGVGYTDTVTKNNGVSAVWRAE